MSGVERMPRISDGATDSVLAFAPIMAANGAPLYAELCKRIPDDPELLALTSYGLAAFPAIHLFVAVQYLLLEDPSDPLAQYYANLSPNPRPPEQAFPDFARFCRQHREEILQLMRTRSIQATMPERCAAILPLLSDIADRAGQPLNLIEIGCSAGILLTFDKYAYALRGRGQLGPVDAPITFDLEVRGAGPELHIPKVALRIGLDLRLVDAKLKDEQRWLLAQFHPEARNRQEHLATALAVVTRTAIDFREGNAIDLLPRAISDSPGPLCVFHSNCVIYWDEVGKTKLEEILKNASRRRTIYRMSMEPEPNRPLELASAEYRDGVSKPLVAATTENDHTVVTWSNWRDT